MLSVPLQARVTALANFPVRIEACSPDERLSALLTLERPLARVHPDVIPQRDFSIRFAANWTTVLDNCGIVVRVTGALVQRLVKYQLGARVRGETANGASPLLIVGDFH